MSFVISKSNSQGLRRDRRAVLRLWDWETNNKTNHKDKICNLAGPPRVKDGADRYSNQFQSAYGVIRFWGFCNAAITAGQLSNFYREKQKNKK